MDTLPRLLRSYIRSYLTPANHLNKLPHASSFPFSICQLVFRPVQVLNDVAYVGSLQQHHLLPSILVYIHPSTHRSKHRNIDRIYEHRHRLSTPIGQPALTSFTLLMHPLTVKSAPFIVHLSPCPSSCTAKSSHLLHLARPTSEYR